MMKFFFLAVIFIVMAIINVNIIIVNDIILIILIMKRHCGHCCYVTVSGLDEKSLLILLDPFLGRIYVMAGTNLSVAGAAYFCGAKLSCDVKPSVRYLHIYVCLAKIQQSSQAFYLKQNSR